jgi:hypothetical protein
VTDWNALERAGEDRLVSRITETWRDIVRDHKQTFRMLAHHPTVERITISDHDTIEDHSNDAGPALHDPTGEAAIHDQTAVRRQEFYSQLLAETWARVEVLDNIRRQMMPAQDTPTQLDDPWCRNCITAQVCSPRKDRYHYCRWCISIRQAYGNLPPVDIIKLHESGDPTISQSEV